MKLISLLIRAATAFACSLLVLWCFGILWFLRSGIGGPCLAVSWSAVLLVKLRKPKSTGVDTPPEERKKWQPSRRLMTTLIGCAGPILLSFFQWPSNSRNWADDHAFHPIITIDGDDVTIEMFRNSVHHSKNEKDVCYETRTFQLSQLDGVWFVVHRFTALEGIAHNFLTFRVMTEDGPQYFSVSVEVRREQGESFSAVRGLFRQYELIYVISDEKDEVGRRAAFHPDQPVHLYPLKATPAQIQTLFQNIAKRIDGLRETPEFYHSLLNNCTNNIAWHADDILKRKVDWLDSRVVAPGYADRYAYELGMIGRDGEDFESLKARCRIDQIAREKGIGETFSADIRRNTD